MFDNIGGKIKGLASFVCGVGILASIILGAITSVNAGTNQLLVIIGIVEMVGGSLVSWISSLGLYAFGQLVENTDAIRDRILEISETPEQVPTQKEQPKPVRKKASQPSDNRCQICQKQCTEEDALVNILLEKENWYESVYACASSRSHYDWNPASDTAVADNTQNNLTREHVELLRRISRWRDEGYISEKEYQERLEEIKNGENL